VGWNRLSMGGGGWAEGGAGMGPETESARGRGAIQGVRAWTSAGSGGGRGIDPSDGRCQGGEIGLHDIAFMVERMRAPEGPGGKWERRRGGKGRNRALRHSAAFKGTMTRDDAPARDMFPG